MNTTEILINCSEYLQVSNLIQDALRTLGWWIVLGLNYLVGKMESALKAVFDLSSFMTDNSVVEYIDTVKPYIYALLGVSIAVLSYKFLANRADLKKVTNNVLFTIAVMAALPTLMDFANDVTFTVTDEMFTDKHITTNILKANISDVLLIDGNHFELPQEKNNLTETAITNINPTEVIKPEDAEQKEVFKNRLVYTKDGKPKLEKLNQGFLDVFKEYYYRYQINWGTLIVTLFMMGFSLLFTSIKTARLLFELAFHQLFAYIVALFDFASGQRLKKVLSTLFSTFLIIMLVPILQQFYILGCNFIQANIDNTLAYLLALIGISFSLIDGPNIVQSVLGIDAGISSAFKTMGGLFYGAKLGGMAIQSAGRMLGKGGKMAGKAVGYGVAAGAGVAGGVQGAKAAYEDYQKKQVDPQTTNADNKATGGNAPRLSDGARLKKSSFFESIPQPDAVKQHAQQPKQAEPPKPNARQEKQQPKTATEKKQTQQPPQPKDTQSSNQSMPNEYPSLGKMATEHYKNKFQNSDFYKRSRKAYTIGQNTAYGAMNRTLQKHENQQQHQQKDFKQPSVPQSNQHSTPKQQPTYNAYTAIDDEARTQIPQYTAAISNNDRGDE